jgi:hypothetical protein
MNFPTTPGSLRRARTRIAATLATTAVALIGAMTMTSAHAAPEPGDRPHPGEDERIEVAGGIAWFFHHGEILKVWDVRKDGLGVRAHLLEVGSSRVTDRGVGGGPKSKNLSIYEGAKVELRICYIDKSGDTVRCSQGQVAYA